MTRARRWLRFQAAWWRWFLESPIRHGAPWYGKTREQRNEAIGLILARYYAREPRRP